MPVVSARPRVTVSAPVPPVMVSTLATVRGVGDVAEGQAVGAGAEVDASRWRSAAPRVMVSAPVPPVMVSTLDDGGGVGAVGEGQGVAAGAEIDASRC